MSPGNDGRSVIADKPPLSGETDFAAGVSSTMEREESSAAGKRRRGRGARGRAGRSLASRRPESQDAEWQDDAFGSCCHSAWKLPRSPRFAAASSPFESFLIVARGARPDCRHCRTVCCRLCFRRLPQSKMSRLSATCRLPSCSVPLVQRRRDSTSSSSRNPDTKRPFSHCYELPPTDCRKTPLNAHTTTRSARPGVCLPLAAVKPGTIVGKDHLVTCHCSNAEL